MNIKNMFKFNKLIHYGDLLAIPFFIALIIYFITIKNKTLFEYIALIFCISALIIDIIFSVHYFRCTNGSL